LKSLCLIIPLLFATLACALSAEGVNFDDPRPILSEDKPSIVFLAPASNSRYAAGAQIQLFAEAQDLGAGVARIEFYDNFDSIIGTVNATNSGGDPILQAIVPWTPIEAQRHFIKAKAFRADNTSSTQAEVIIEVVAVPGLTLPAAQTAATPTAEPQPTATQAAASAAPTDASTSAQVAPPPTTAAAVTVQARVTVEVLNVRVAPRTDADMAALPLAANTTIQLVGRSEDNRWFATPLPSGSAAWVWANSLEIVEGDAAALPLVATQ
jgi:hypothetical protein